MRGVTFDHMPSLLSTVEMLMPKPASKLRIVYMFEQHLLDMYKYEGDY